MEMIFSESNFLQTSWMSQLKVQMRVNLSEKKIIIKSFFLAPISFQISTVFSLVYYYSGI